MLNLKKLLTLLVRTAPSFKTVASGSYANTAANAWFYTNISFTIPTGHMYLIRANCGYSAGKPIGLGIHNSSSISSATGAPIFAHEDSYVSFSPVWLVGEGTFYLFCKRSGSSGTNTNAYVVQAIDLDFN